MVHRAGSNGKGDHRYAESVYFNFTYKKWS